MLGCGLRLGSVMAKMDCEWPQGLPLGAWYEQVGIGNHMSRLTRRRLQTEARLASLAPHAT